MDISHIKEEDFCRQARAYLEWLRRKFVLNWDVGGMKKERKHFMVYFNSFNPPYMTQIHELRALDIAEAECLLTQMIKG